MSNAGVIDWWHDDGCTAVSSGCIEGSCVVGRIGDDRPDFLGHIIDKRDARRGVIDVRVGQSLGNDDASSIDAEMELLPALDTLSSVFGETEDAKRGVA